MSENMATGGNTATGRRALVVGLAALAIVATGVVVTVLGGGSTELLFALIGGVVITAIVVGVYTLGTRSGHPHSHAVAEAAVALGVVYIVALVARLLTEFGA